MLVTTSWLRPPTVHRGALLLLIMKLLLVLFLALAVLCVPPKEPRRLRKNEEAAANDAQSPVWSKAATADADAQELYDDGDHSSCTDISEDDDDDDCPSDDDEDRVGENSSSLWMIADKRDLVVEQEQPGKRSPFSPLGGKEYAIHGSCCGLLLDVPHVRVSRDQGRARARNRRARWADCGLGPSHGLVGCLAAGNLSRHEQFTGKF